MANGSGLPLQGYRLVPADDWQGRYPEDDEIDLVELARLFWGKREKILKITGAFLLLGLLIALFSPKEYETSATLMPESQSSQSRMGSLLQQYGGLLGMSGNFDMGSEGSIPTQLYPNIVQSLPFQAELMNTPVRFKAYDTTATPHIFFTEINSPSVLGYIKKFTIGLPGQIIGLFSQDNEKEVSLPVDIDREEILLLSEKQMQTINTLRERINVVLDEQSGVLTLTATMPDPQAAAELGHAGIRLLKEYMREYRTQKATEDLEFIRRQTKEARQRFEQAQLRLAKFRDSNVSLATAKARTREQELQSEYDLAFGIYNSLNQQLEQAKITVQEQTPVFSVLQPVNVPLNDTTSGMLVLILTGMLGGIISLGWVLIENWWRNVEARFE